MSSQTQPTLLERLRDGGDPLAWDDFSERYWRLIFTFARRRGCTDDTAEEIVQNVMTVVFEQRDVFCYDRSRGRFRDWLGAVVRKQVAKYRRRPAQRIRSVGGAAPLPEPADEDADAEQQWTADFEQSLLVVLLDIVRREVAPETYQAFELLALGNLSGRDVARITGQSRNAAYLARRNVTKRLVRLAAGYRNDGRLSEQIKQALAQLPAPRVERSVSSRLSQVRQSMTRTYLP